jgi:hypothetical protein
MPIWVTIESIKKFDPRPPSNGRDASKRQQEQR